MEVDDYSIVYIASTIYNITIVEGSIVALCGYNDKNYSLVDAANLNRYVLKVVVDEHESKQELTGGYEINEQQEPYYTNYT